MNKSSNFIILVFLMQLHLHGSPFINLDFEMVDTNTTRFTDFNGLYSVGYGPIEDLLPGWQLVYQGDPMPQIAYNGTGTPLERGWAGIISRETYRSFGIFNQGEHSLFFDFGDLGDVRYVLSQKGDIPVGAVQYAIDGASLFSLYELSLNGTVIGRNGDISAFQGMSDVDLSITFFNPDDGSIPGLPTFSFLDGVTFIVPEPSTGLLFLVGGPILGWMLYRGRHRGS
jgi:hypothetical protein